MKHLEKAYAKINLVLDILYKRTDGYHELYTIMQTLDLYDELSFKINENGNITLSHGIEYLPLGPKNIINKTVELMRKKFNIIAGLDITLKKNIPISAGLGGGSADAAATIRACNAIFNLKLETEEMENIAKDIGADVPFMIKGGTALAEGIGDKLTRLNPIKDLSVILVKPNISVSTKWAYKNFKSDNKTNVIDKNIITAIENNDKIAIIKSLRNDLESITEKKHYIITDIKEKLNENGAIGSLMSGSGPTVFGLYTNEITARQGMENLLKIYKNRKMRIILANTL